MPPATSHEQWSQAPRLPQTYVPRQVLWERLDRAVASAVTLLVAPVGAGKTLGVGGWLQVARPDLGPDALWAHADATWDAERLSALLDHSAGAAGRGRDVPRLVVVDDAHVLPAAAVRLVDERLSAAPDSMRVLLLSRWDLPLTRLVPELLGHFTMLRGGTLRMDDAEAAALIHEHTRTTDPEVVRTITAHAAGWCAALVLTARAVAADPDPAAAARRYAEGEGQVADRVVSEVFASLTPRERHTLLCVAREEAVSAATAAHLSRDPAAAEALAGLATTGLLVTRLDGRSPDGAVQYRIHPLLAEVIRRRLAAGGVDVERARATVGQAVALDLERGERHRAFDRLVAVGQLDAAAEVLGSDGAVLVMGGHGPAIAAFVRQHPEVIGAHPDSWFAVALERWVVNDVEAARHWLDRVTQHEVGSTGGAGGSSCARLACARLMRARLGLEPVDDAVVHAERVVQASYQDSAVGAANRRVLPQLLTELGITRNWTGDLAGAESSLAAAIDLCRSRDLPALAAEATSHLAMTEYLAGRERACAQVATEALGLLGEPLPWRPRFAAARSSLALLLAGLVDLPWPSAPILPVPEPTPVHAADLCTRFWLSMRDSRLALLSGSVPDAERILIAPLDLPVSVGRLPAHLRSALLIERAFLASLAADQATLRDLEYELLGRPGAGEAALVAGLRADLAGERRAAAELFRAAADTVSLSQPPTRALALMCEAQLLDALGDPDAAMDRLREAVTATEVRRNAVPFLGWSRQGTPVATLLHRVDRTDGSWARQVAADGAGRPDIMSLFAPTTATARERSATPSTQVHQALSPREREVLGELARGSTYADIAANLVVSENTVKTHVSSLYGKLAVSRRSEALAVARSLHLL
ncbi:LuxR C-terminal-related transcriptional regulator [Nocardioides sp. W7]|uniref:LuxR C-terminal-related transcriptional regulator n=1 Tax=Nocardioides sp. W7 TaxID=2931390 RepID=UPI001FD375FA|nr:LuxR C-terminal-related transcriptional regulator [Nocardioides sp. W7]